MTGIKRVLWLDNDLAPTEPYRHALERTGYRVMVVKSISECEALLNSEVDNPFSLLLLDVMIPTKTEAEERNYDPQKTNNGALTGLAVYKHWAQRLRTAGTKVLVFTVRIDRNVKEEFLAAGLSQDCFATKLDLRDVEDFLKRIGRIINTKEG